MSTVPIQATCTIIYPGCYAVGDGGLNTIDSMSSTPRGKAKTVYTFPHSAAQKGGCIQTCHWRVLCFNVRVDNAVFLIVHVSDNHACSASKVGIKFGDQKVCSVLMSKLAIVESTASEPHNHGEMGIKKISVDHPHARHCRPCTFAILWV